MVGAFRSCANVAGKYRAAREGSVREWGRRTRDKLNHIHLLDARPHTVCTLPTWLGAKRVMPTSQTALAPWPRRLEKLCRHSVLDGEGFTRPGCDWYPFITRRCRSSMTMHDARRYGRREAREVDLQGVCTADGVLPCSLQNEASSSHIVNHTVM